MHNFGYKYGGRTRSIVRPPSVGHFLKRPAFSKYPYGRQRLLTAVAINPTIEDYVTMLFYPEFRAM